MTNLDLISAIGAVCDADLEYSERPVARRLWASPRILLTAALIALLSLTAFAAPTIFHALRGVNAKQFSISRIFVEQGKPTDLWESTLDVSLDVQMSPDAPSRIKTYYVPLLPAKQLVPVPLTVTRGMSVSFRSGVLLQWQGADGESVAFRQYAWPDDTGGQSFDSVSTGFDADYAISQAELGGYTVQRIVVEPSEKEEDGVRAAHPGLQKLYWSDGLYIFSMEVNYSMSDARLAEILESIQPVPDALDYAVIEEIPVPEREAGPCLRPDQILLPSSLPQGYAQEYGRRYENGECWFLWLKAGSEIPSTLNLSISTAGQNDWRRKDWETTVIHRERTERDVNGITVLCYESDWKAELLWRIDDADYALSSAGPARLGVETLLEIMDGLRGVENIDAVLMDWPVRER